jgi:hypothetical protein
MKTESNELCVITTKLMYKYMYIYPWAASEGNGCITNTVSQINSLQQQINNIVFPSRCATELENKE